MKIGILTLPLHINYGGILQAYALQTVLERMGHKVYVIEKEKKKQSISIYKMPYTYGKRIIKNLLGKRCPIFLEQKNNKEQPIIKQHTDKFIHKYIHIFKYTKFHDIKESDYDAIVVGSDQIWRPQYFKIDTIENAYLKFAEKWNIKRIAYAASFGTDEWEYTPKQTKTCGALIKKFDEISVREDSGVRLCLKHFGVKAQHVLDPTMLLDKKDYIKLFNTTNIPQSNGNLLCYILDDTDEKTSLIDIISKERTLTPFKVNAKTNTNATLKERIQPPLEQWLRGFYDADFVITDSFHACVFSIIFNKPFIIYGNNKRGLSRFTSLLDMFDLKELLITDISGYKHIDIKKIKWDNVNEILEKYRKISFDFLKILL